MKKLLLALSLLLFIGFVNCDTITFASNPPEDLPIQYETVTLTIKSRLYSEQGCPVDGHAWLRILEGCTVTEDIEFPNEGNTWSHNTQIINDPRVIIPDYNWKSWVRRCTDNALTYIPSDFDSDDTHVYIYGL